MKHKYAYTQQFTKWNEKTAQASAMKAHVLFQTLVTVEVHRYDEHYELADRTCKTE